MLWFKHEGQSNTKTVHFFFGPDGLRHSTDEVWEQLCLSTQVPCLSTPFQVDTLLFALILPIGLWCQISPRSWMGPLVWRHPSIMKVFSCYTHIHSILDHCIRSECVDLELRLIVAKALHQRLHKYESGLR